MIHLIDNSTSPKSKDGVRYRCDVCGYEGIVRYAHFKSGVGCSVCNGKKVVAGINDLWTTRPDIARYLKSKEDGYHVTQFSHKHLPFKCRKCGDVETMRVAYVSEYGYHCRVCNSAISYPNRFVSAVLSEANVDFDREKVFPWSSLKRYDFFIKPSTIIEVHGEQHYKGFRGESFASIEEIRKNDHKKETMATNNGIEHYIIIDASVSKFDFIKREIENSEIAKLFDLTSVDWLKVRETVDEGILDDVIKKYNDGCEMNEIAKKLHISEYTVRSCIKLGKDKGLCEYDLIKERLKCQEKAAKSRRKKVACITTGYEFNSLNEAATFYGISPKALSNCLVGRSQSTRASDGRKLKWKYL